MIEISITDTPDNISHGDYKFALHHITLGKGMKCSIIINDPELLKEHAIFRLTNRGLIFESQEFFIHNDKKVTGTIIVNKNDRIVIGHTHITVVNFDASNLLAPESYYNRVKELSNKLHIIELISAVEEEYVYQTEKELDALER